MTGSPGEAAVHALRQDGSDPDASDRRTDASRAARKRKRRGGQDTDEFLLTVSTLARLDRMSAAEFEMLCEYAVPAANGRTKRR
jgi:hypothetical protein